MAAKHEAVLLWKKTNQQQRCLENKLVQRADVRQFSEFADVSLWFTKLIHRASLY
jgi:hypothetical protein